MERDAQKENDDRLKRREGDRLLGHFARLSRISSTVKSGSLDSSEGGDVVKECHPVTDKICAHPPTTTSQQGQGSQLRGSKI